MVAPRTIWALPLAVFIYKRCCTLNRPESLNANFRYSCFVNTTAVHVGAGGHHALFLYLVLNGILARQSYTTFQKQDLNFVTFGVQCYFSKFLLFLGAVTDEKQAVATVFPAVIGNVVALTSDFLPPTFSCGLPEDGRLIIPTGQVMPFCFCVKLHRKNTFAVMKKKKKKDYTKNCGWIHGGNMTNCFTKCMDDAGWVCTFSGSSLSLKAALFQPWDTKGACTPAKPWEINSWRGCLL